MNTSSNKQFSVSVVIPNYNGKHLLEANLPSVVGALSSISISEIIVIDDASTDDSVAFLKSRYPNIKLLVNDSNKGFSPTINRGIKIASNDLVLALNSDVKLNPDYFEKQFIYFSQADTFGVMGKIVSPDGILQDAAKFPSVSAKGIKATYNYTPTANVNGKWLPSFFLSGANALMDRKKLMALNGFDELYAPFYYEDADLGIRAWRVGWKCYFEPKAVCTHELSSTIGKLKSEKKQIIIERNRIFFNLLHLQGWQLIVYKWWLQLRSFGRSLIGKNISAKALQEVKANQTQLQQSAQNLLELQKKNYCNLAVNEVEQLILLELSAVKYHTF